MRHILRMSLSTVLIAVAVPNCGGTIERSEDTSTQVAALTDPALVMGFESTSYWSASGGTLGASSVHTQGSQSLSVTEQGYVRLTSVKLSTLSSVSPNLAVDIWLPKAQPNPYWYGQAEILLSIPSQGVYNAYVGEREFTGLPLGTFNTLSFVVDPSLLPALRARYADLTFQIVLNTPSGTPRQYLVDNLRFLPTNEIVWPNSVSQATSDPWIVQHHSQITMMQPRILALNFVNARTNADMLALMGNITASIREATRPHGAENPTAATFLDPHIPYAIDLRDATPPTGWPYNNSTKYPRQNPVQGQWGFDYSQLFTQAYADLYHIPDPQNPSHNLTLCELSQRGLVHEVWMYADADVPEPFGGAAEVLGIQPFYDANGQRIGSTMNRCAGNGCFDAEDVIPASCTNTLRIGFVNDTRGAGCYMESLGHGWEHIGASNDVPYLTGYWPEFAGFDLDQRYGVPFSSWYACGTQNCIAFPTDHSVNYNSISSFSGTPVSGSIDPYIPVCGNAHFPPNARQNYDIGNTQTVQSSCNGYRTAGGPGHGDPASPVSANNWSNYGSLAPDCTGAWAVYWWQRFPSVGTAARDASGATMKNWWPFFYY